ncbi:hypothetical protein [Streptomyces tubercidicus]|uniref:hypothetical protein n=1 Tax=Streptomyces tubercidicus TaxID=47759 RepID=UPI003465B7ED
MGTGPGAVGPWSSSGARASTEPCAWPTRLDGGAEVATAFDRCQVGPDVQALFFVQAGR